MAMIICPECGKRFSDRAKACPECGWPTASIVNTPSSEQMDRKRRSAEKAMLLEVSRAKQKADDANRLFERRSAAIQVRTSRNYDLFSADTAGSVVGVIAEAERACDELYASLQALVAEVDSVCRPYLPDDPGAAAIKAVAELISSLNDDSEIESSGSMTFNGTYIGNTSASAYMPSVQARMIEKYWKSRYASTPEGIEAETKQRKAAERMRQRRETEQKKAKERKAAEKEHMNKVVSECRSKIKLYREALDKAVSDRYAQAVEEVENYKRQLAAEKTDLERERSALSAFHIRKRQEQKDAIRKLDAKLEKLSDSGLLDAERDRLKQRADEAASQYSQSVERYLDARFPNRCTREKLRYARSAEDEAAFEDSVQASVPCPEPPKLSEIFDDPTQ